MIRIISGVYGGRLIKTPTGNLTHPMSEKIRGAMFNALGDVSDLSMLDAFSGSGAIAIEASSRGIGRVISIDNSKKACQVILDNICKLSIKNIKVTKANINSWLNNNPSSLFDIVVCDPPYDKVNISTLNNVKKHVKMGGVFVLSLPPGISYETGLELIFKKDYNDAQLYMYRR